MNRPYTIMNMAASLDGKISTTKVEKFQFPSRYDRYMMDVIRAKANAVIIGANTLRTDAPPILIKDQALFKKRKTNPINVVLSRNLNIPYHSRFMDYELTEKIIFTCKKAPLQKITKFRKKAQVIVLPENDIDPAKVSRLLLRMGIKTLLVEGGGKINFSFLEKNLIDELYVTICPLIIGGEKAPTITDGTGFAIPNVKKLKLISAEIRGSEIFTHYSIE